MDRVPVDQGYECCKCETFIPIAVFDGINHGSDGAICFKCRKDDGKHAKIHLKRLAESMGFKDIETNFTDSIIFRWDWE